VSGRRTAAEWGRPPEPHEPAIDVLIGTVGRTAELAVTLAGLAAQDGPAFRVIISDQSDDHPMGADPAVQAMLRVLAVQGRQPEVLRHLRVCHVSPGDVYNCGRCEKCLRTMVALRVTGLDRWASSFPPLDLGRLPSVHLPVNSFTWRRLRRRAEQAGNQTELVSALDSLLG
jgi:hypothetical protein